MPVTVRKRGSKYRVAETNGRLARGQRGNPVDGGGHSTRGRALAQAKAINARK